MPENIRALTDGTHYIHQFRRGIVGACEIRDLMVCTIECRTDERVHSRRDAHVADLALRLQLGHASEQPRGGGNQVTAGLDPEFQLRMLCAHRRKQGIELLQVEAHLIATLRHPESTATSVPRTSLKCLA